ncbi:type II secretion system protein GspG [Oxalobacteraceae bacterium CAVE-383]|nr:type II secretion system protein GspG [Oxalobacteraceae bacterium CAVE-383]
MPNVFFFRNPPFLINPRTGRPRYGRIFLIFLAVAAIGFALPKIVTSIYKQHNSQASIAQHDMAAIVQGLAEYKRDNGNYPNAEQGLLALVLKPARGPAANNWRIGGYVDRLPHDPWGHSYQYRIDETGQNYQVFSYGPAGPDAGDDNNDSLIFAR